MKIVLIAWLREIARTPMHSFLSVIGVALGIAAVIAVEVANHSARESFIAASEVMTDNVTHTITGEVTDDLYRQIRLQLNHPTQPIVQGSVRITQPMQVSATLFGIDPISRLQFGDSLNVIAPDAENSNQSIMEPFTALATIETVEGLGT